MLDKITPNAQALLVSRFRLASRFAVPQPLGAVGLLAIVLMFCAAFLARWLAPYDPVVIDFGAMLAAPSPAHLFGTDQFGRDVLSRVIYGTRTALSIGFWSSFIGCTAGTALGVAY